MKLHTGLVWGHQENTNLNLLHPLFPAPYKQLNLPADILSDATFGSAVSSSPSLVVAGQFESGDNVHGLKLLKQQLAGVRDSQGGNVTGRLTVVAPAEHQIYTINLVYQETVLTAGQARHDNLAITRNHN